MKRILLVIAVLAVAGGIWIGFGEKLGHFLEGAEHEETHAQRKDADHKDEHGHGAEAKQTPDDGKKEKDIPNRKDLKLG